MRGKKMSVRLPQNGAWDWGWVLQGLGMRESLDLFSIVVNGDGGIWRGRDLAHPESLLGWAGYTSQSAKDLFKVRI